MRILTLNLWEVFSMLRVVSSCPYFVSSYCTYGKQSWCVAKGKPCTAFYFPSIGRCSLGGAL